MNNVSEATSQQGDLFSLETLVHLKFAEHGLSDWSFKIDKAKRRLGSCQYYSKTITLSVHLLKLPQEEIIQTLLHEIAHALVGPRAGHGPRWKKQALAIGCNAERASKLTLVEAPTRRIGCSRCTYNFSIKRFRLPRWVTRRHRCPQCYKGKIIELRSSTQPPDIHQ